MANKFLLTEVGTPNTCCVCGKMQHVKWYAINEDEARSGQGRCATDAGVKPKTTRKKSATKRKAAPKAKPEPTTEPETAEPEPEPTE